MSQIDIDKKSSFQTLFNKFTNDKMFLSFDIDSIRSSDCKGVSCPSIRGLTGENALEICLLAGKKKEVVLLDLSEFNPDVDEFTTGRLTGFMFYYFLLGYSQRID
jgi:arginase family enzyme